MTICILKIRLLKRRENNNMNTYGTSAICPCCGKTLYTSNIPKYSFVCKDCNKNFYTKEVKDTFAEYWDEVTESTKQL